MGVKMKKVLLVLMTLLLLGLITSFYTGILPVAITDLFTAGNITIRNEVKLEDSAEEQLHIVFVTPLIDNEVWQGAKDGFEAAAKDYNFRGDWVGPSAIDIDEMIKQIKIAIAEKADGIITQGANPKAMAPVIMEAHEAGIPVVIVNSDIPDAPRLAYIGTDPKKLGNLGAEAILKKMGNTPIKVAYMTADLNIKIGLDMVAGYEEILQTAPGGYENLIVSEDRADLLNSIKLFEYILDAYPECNLVISVTGSGGVAAQTAVKEKGLTEEVTIMAIDDISQTLDGVKNGGIFGTMTQNFYRKGYQGAQWICEYVRNGKIPEQLLNDSGTMVVTKENIDTYQTEMMERDAWE